MLILNALTINPAKEAGMTKIEIIILGKSGLETDIEKKVYYQAPELAGKFTLTVWRDNGAWYGALREIIDQQAIIRLSASLPTGELTKETAGPALIKMMIDSQAGS